MLATQQANEDIELPKLRYSRYYEHDGQLRAYANRAMLIAFLFALVALMALGYAIHVGTKPPTVIRVDSKGEASVLGRQPQPVTVVQNAETEPSDLEKTAFVRLFLERYLNFSPATVNLNWANAVSMMTSNLRRSAMTRMKAENTVGNIQEDQTRSEFNLGLLEKADKDPLTYVAHGVKTVHHLHDHTETTDKIVSQFRIRLAVEKRSEENPSGLLIADYLEEQIDGEKRGQKTPDQN
jgi:hypothetical protein